MSIKKVFKLIKKNDIYYDDLIKNGVSLPNGRIGMRIRAILSFVIYGTSFNEYFGYKFWLRSRKEKKTYMTRRHMFKFFDKYNPIEFRERIGDKSKAQEYYGEFLKREQFHYTDGYNEFVNFCQKYKYIFIKKAIGWGGEGARVVDVSDINCCKLIWESLSPEYVVEPRIVNCSEIQKLNPSSLNTIKVTILIVQGKPEIQFAMLRIGNGNVVDNIHLGGIGAGINIDNGCVETLAVDRHFFTYEYHPITKRRVLGFKIPYWDEVKNMACSAAMVTPQLRYSSWDIAVTSNGPILIEGNWDAEFYTEQVIYQRGHRTIFEEKLDR